MTTPLGYVLGPEIGRGGFAVVRRATDPRGNTVALKQPLPVPEAAERMRREIDVQRKYAGEHVMPILDADEAAPWFTMPIASGNLHQLWDSGKLGDDAEQVSLAIVKALAEGLRSAHSDGVVHRDITPGNLLALPDHRESSGLRWVVADFGLVRRPIGQTTNYLTSTGHAGMGTPGFTGPETYADAHQVDQRLDVYSAGRLVAWLATGRVPLPLVPLLPSGRLRGIVSDATDTDPDVRPATMEVLRERLERVIGEPDVSPRQQVQDALDGDDPNLDLVRGVVRANLDNERLLIDDLARMDRATVKKWTKVAPEEAARVAVAMCRTLRKIDWGHRSFDYANAPLGWAFAVLHELAKGRDEDRIEDVATAFFEAEEQWDRYAQLNVTTNWLQNLEAEPATAAVARAITRSRARSYYQKAMRGKRPRSRAIDLVVDE